MDEHCVRFQVFATANILNIYVIYRFQDTKRIYEWCEMLAE